jgi:hypothetical protein
MDIDRHKRLTKARHYSGVARLSVLLFCAGCSSTSTGPHAAPVTGGPAPAADGGGGTPTDPNVTGCNLHTAFDGDELCIGAPPADLGFQIHIGPSNYDDPAELAKYVIDAGAETNDYYFLKSGNDADIYFYKRNYRMRPRSHHLIVSEVQADHADGWNTPAAAGSAPTSAATGFDVGRRLGGSQNVSKDNPIGGVIPPENEGIGMPLGAHAQLSVNLHHFNSGDHPILREAWVNFWYVDAATVTQEAKEMFAVGGFAMAIKPGEHTTLHYTCDVQQDGRVLTMYGHRHAHNVRFTSWRTRGGQQDLVYQGFNWQDPMVLEFSSVTTNPAPDTPNQIEGGWSGPLDLKQGDVLEWECEVNNTGNTTLNFTNETVNGEMCILVGDTIGPSIGCIHP